MNLLSKLFRKQQPVQVETISDLYQQCIKMGGKMYISDEYGNTFYIEKVEEHE